MSNVQISVAERCAEFATGLARRAGLELLPISPEKLIRHAERRVPGERVDEVAVERLRLLCRSFEEDACLNVHGRMVARFQLGAALIARLRLRKIQREKPEIFEAPLDQPIIVTGLPRSGTTFLQRLLHQAPGSRSFAAWELNQPIPPDNAPDQRREFYEKAIKNIHKRTPDVDAIHKVGVDEPEECTCLSDASLINLTFGHTGPCRQYIEWYAEQDKTETYDVYRAMLQIKQWENPGQRLVLKGPAHMARIGYLARAVPEACLVQTHRDPLQVVASAYSLFQMMYASTTQLDALSKSEAQESIQGSLRWFLSDNAKQREGIEDRIVDVLYADLTSDPVGVVKRIYDHFDLPWSDEIRQASERYVQERPQNKYGRHRYKLEDGGWSEEDVKKAFADYRARWGFAEPGDPAAAQASVGLR